MNKLLHIAYGVLKSGVPFDPNYGKQFSFTSWHPRRYLRKDDKKSRVQPLTGQATEPGLRKTTEKAGFNP